MSKDYKYIKIFVVIVDVFCIVISLKFLVQAEQRKKDECGEDRPTIVLSESLDEKEEVLPDFLNAYKETQRQLAEAEETYEALEIVYNFKAYVDDTAAKLYRDSSETPYAANPYIERYFMVSEGELREKLGEDTFKPLTGAEAHGVFLPVGEDIWLRYKQEDKSALPIGIVVKNPQINMGFGEAKAGMTIYDIKELPGEEYKQEMGWLTYEMGEDTACYLCFEDERYDYYYFSTDGKEWLQSTILYITRKAG